MMEFLTEVFDKTIEILGSATLVGGLVALFAQEKIKGFTNKNVEKFKAELKSAHDVEMKALDRKLKVEDEMQEYKLSFLHSLNDLQSRIYHLVKSDMAGKYYKNGDEQSKDYVVNNTVFLIGQYFAWLEKIRTEVQFIQLADSNDTNTLSKLLDQTVTVWQENLEGKATFAVWAGNQRAIGEVMLEKTDSGRHCIGYGKFLTEFSNKKNPIVANLDIQVLALLDDVGASLDRLKSIHSVLIDTIILIDKDQKIERKFLEKLV
ncbi:hypothetical protein [Vibrio hyugaensis]|uniref:hypothetical protein n=1 Tax=Vibrio hyugaensis TaxID=1534743 RepID=UPI0011B05C4B|nr:hypothetical protein [Vibrio hyugaensis]